MNYAQIKHLGEARSIDFDGRYSKPGVKRWLKKRAGKLRRGDYKHWVKLGQEEVFSREIPDPYENLCADPEKNVICSIRECCGFRDLLFNELYVSFYTVVKVSKRFLSLGELDCSIFGLTVEKAAKFWLYKKEKKC